jgi:Fe-S-cluster containining protein
MEELELKGFHCGGCSGTCCTSAANSMMVTPLEAAEIVVHLKKSSRLTAQLKQKCEETVRDFRLDHLVGNGKKSFLRRTYTCPFFESKELGCSLSRSVKPYGCLAFNAHHQEIKASDHCYSEQALLEKREQSFSQEKELNQTLQKKFQLPWEKQSLPLAMLEIWDKEISDADLLQY